MVLGIVRHPSFVVNRQRVWAPDRSVWIVTKQRVREPGRSRIDHLIFYQQLSTSSLPANMKQIARVLPSKKRYLMWTFLLVFPLISTSVSCKSVSRWQAFAVFAECCIIYLQSWAILGYCRKYPLTPMEIRHPVRNAH